MSRKSGPFKRLVRASGDYRGLDPRPSGAKKKRLSDEGASGAKRMSLSDEEASGAQKVSSSNEVPLAATKMIPSKSHEAFLRKGLHVLDSFDRTLGPPEHLLLTIPGSAQEHEEHECTYNRALGRLGNGKEGTVYEYGSQNPAGCPLKVAVKVGNKDDQKGGKIDRTKYDKKVREEARNYAELTKECPKTWPIFYGPWNLETAEHRNPKFYGERMMRRSDDPVDVQDLAVMQYFQNDVFKDIERIAKEDDREIARKSALEIMLQMCQNMMCPVQENQLILDVKPENMLSNRGDNLKFADAPHNLEDAPWSSLYVLWQNDPSDILTEKVWGIAASMLEVILAYMQGDSNAWNGILWKWMHSREYPIEKPSRRPYPLMRTRYVKRCLHYLETDLAPTCEKHDPLMYNAVMAVHGLMSLCSFVGGEYVRIEGKCWRIEDVEESGDLYLSHKGVLKWVEPSAVSGWCDGEDDDKTKQKLTIRSATQAISDAIMYLKKAMYTPRSPRHPPPGSPRHPPPQSQRRGR